MAISLVDIWAVSMFLCASDLLMILRVYAMYNRSKTIISVFLVIYITATALTMVPPVCYITQKLYLAEYVGEVMDVKFCVVPDATVSLFRRYTTAPRLVLGTLLCIFAVTNFVRQSLETHNAIRQWRSNRYMKLLVRESILYFIVNFIDIVFWMSYTVTSETPSVVLVIIVEFFPFILAPRFVISMRELHSHAVEHIDTGFGVASQRMSPHINTIVFASGGDMPVGDAETTGGEGRAAQV